MWGSPKLEFKPTLWGRLKKESDEVEGSNKPTLWGSFKPTLWGSPKRESAAVEFESLALWGRTKIKNATTP